MKAIILGAVFACLAILALNVDDGRYVAVDKKLTEVPNDILSTAEQIILDQNFVSTIAEGTWDNLNACNYLSLAHNLLKIIKKHMFGGLDALEHLNLNDNLIHSIHDDALCPLHILKRLDLANNQLSHLHPEVFGCVQSLNYLELSGNMLKTFSMDYHTMLKLGLSDNPLQCTEKLCWLKEGERNQSLTWTTDENDVLQMPYCDNYPDAVWKDVILQCSIKVTREGHGTSETVTISMIVHEKYIYDKSGWVFGYVFLVLFVVLLLAVVLGLLIWKCKLIEGFRKSKYNKVSPVEDSSATITQESFHDAGDKDPQQQRDLLVNQGEQGVDPELPTEELMKMKNSPSDQVDILDCQSVWFKA